MNAPAGRELLLLRHAKSDWDGAAATDFERPLTRRGKDDAVKIGAWLEHAGLVPDYVASSPARRAHQTVLRVCRALEIAKGHIAWDPAIYEAELSDLLAVLGRCPAGAARVLLVGHNPGLEALVEYLSGAELTRPDDGKQLPTGALARLAMPEDWTHPAPGGARLVSLTRPRDL